MHAGVAGVGCIVRHEDWISPHERVGRDGGFIGGSLLRLLACLTVALFGAALRLLVVAAQAEELGLARV